MKKFFSVILCCILFVSLFALGGCGEVVLKDGPLATDAVTGNGSLCVKKGNYLYFVNGYVSSSNLSGKDNNYGTAKNGAIYRAKLDNNELMYDISTDDDGKEVKTLKNVELLVPKIAGFEYSDLHIFGNSLFFTSPNTEKDNTGKVRFDLTDVFVVSINGGKITKVANALNISAANQINYNFINSKVYVTFITDSKLYSVCVNGTKVESTNMISESCTSFGTFEQSQFVYYTRNYKDGENGTNGNVLCKANLTNNQETILKIGYQEAYETTFSIKKVSSKQIYYTKTDSLTTNAYIYGLSIDNIAQEKQYTIVSYSSDQYIHDLEQENNVYVLVSNNSKLLRITGIENIETDIVEIYNGEFTYLGAFGQFVYGKDASGNIIRINLDSKSQEVLLESNENLSFDMAQNFDFETRYIYYYAKYTGNNDESGYYLNRLNLSDKTTELVGKLLDKHAKTEN